MTLRPLLTRSNKSASIVVAVVGIAGAMLTTGCGSDEGHVKTFPVRGEVLYKGNPATGAKLIFVFLSSELRGQGIPTPQARVDDDGEFQVGCFGKSDGLPAGEYGIAIIWREKRTENNGYGDERPPDRLRGRYGNPQRSKLTVTVTEDGNYTIETIHLK